MNRPRLFIVTPPLFKTEEIAEKLKLAFGGGDVACVLIYMPQANPKELQTTANILVPIIQNAGAAALIYRDTQVAGRSGADGVHVDTSLEDLKIAVESFSPEKIVGTGGTKLKHEAMEWAETGCDYMFFGKLDLNEKENAHDKTLERATWWAELFETPCVALAGNTLDTLNEVAATGADFVAMKDALWASTDDPSKIVSDANAILEKHSFPDV